ncbi:MAG: tRNA pseudouridine(55) synthase TruB [Chloroflexi bacterium]|nr:tRNA pseudouridine(55) synthase TruB [Chloroflexota bacterium]
MGANGILNVNKPSGCTSFSIVAMVRRLAGEKRVGHAGTLDPAATGVLPICLGQATRITEYLHDCTKEYIALIEFGTTTDTFDREGKVTCRKDTALVTFQLIERSLMSFQGTIQQVPPAYSAIKVKGRQSYELARKGIPVSHQPRKVKIDLIEILGFENLCLKIKIRCSKGTYIRSLANDLGEMLGCGAYLKDLVRTAYGPFTLDSSISVDDIRTALAEGNLDRLLYPVDYPLQQWDSQVATDEISCEIVQGHDMRFDNVDATINHHICVYSPEKKLLAIMKFVPETLLWHPEKVFSL